MPQKSTSTDARSAAQRARAFDLFDVPQAYFDDPGPWLRLLRDHDPIHHNADDTVLLTRHQDVRKVWRDRSASVDKTALFTRKFGPGPLLAHHTTGMLFRDPPDHDRLRILVNNFFEPASVARFSEFIGDLADQLIDEAAERRTFDVVSDFAAKIPISLITRILGVPPEDSNFLREIGLRVLFPLNPSVGSDAIASGNAAVTEFIDYIIEHINRVRRRGVDGNPASVIEALVAAEASGHTIDEDEIIHMCLLVFNGGHETTTNLIAVGVDGLLKQPDQFRLLSELTDSELPVAVEELIRYVSPLQLQGRRVNKPVELSSGIIDADTEVILCQASANHDERVISDPDRLDLGRTPNPHMSFGLGVHACLGNQLARLEARIVFPKLARRLPELARAGTAVFNPNVRFRGLRSLPLDAGAPA